MKISAFWCVTPYSLFEVCRQLRGYCGPRHQEVKKKCSSVKSWQTCTKMQGIEPQKKQAKLSPY